MARPTRAELEREVARLRAALEEVAGLISDEALDRVAKERPDIGTSGAYAFAIGGAQVSVGVALGRRLYRPLADPALRMDGEEMMPIEDGNAPAEVGQ